MAELTINDQIKEKILSLESALTGLQPNMPSLLREIWQALKANPDCATLLTEHEISVIVSGLKKQTATEISCSALKAKSSRALKSLLLTDL